MRESYLVQRRKQCSLWVGTGCPRVKRGQMGWKMKGLRTNVTGAQMTEMNREAWSIFGGFGSRQWKTLKPSELSGVQDGHE